MKRKWHLFFAITVAFLIFAVPAHAIFCGSCGTNNPEGSEYCMSCGNPLQPPENNIYERSSALFEKEQYDQVISLLEGFCAYNPKDIKSRLLLAKAYIEECELLKQKGSAGYKSMVIKAYEIGKEIHLARDEHLPEALYVCGRSFHINERSERAIKYIKKAIRLSNAPPPEYFIALGDAQFTVARNEDPTGLKTPYYLLAKTTYQKAIDADTPNNAKAKAYYKIGVLHLYLDEKKSAGQALNSALTLAETDALILRIKHTLESL